MSADFAAIDWGTSSFRLWLMTRKGQVLDECRGPEGMQHCIEAGFAEVLDRYMTQVGAAPDLPVLICGMAGARQGWFEAPYADLPAEVAQLAGLVVRLPHGLAGARDIRMMPGLAQRDPACPDVMRGEETQLAGLAKAGHEGLVCMPGTHCKWARLEGGAVTGFQSFLTGELFSLLSGYSILRHAMPEKGRILPDDPAFTAALDEALADPAAFMGQLFPIRAGQLLGFRSPEESFARLSGLLIGAEVGRQVAGNSAPVILVGQEGLGALYAEALRRSGTELVLANAEEATRDALLAAATEIWGWQDA